MRKMERLTAVLLAAVLTVGLVPGALAAGEPVPVKSDNTFGLYGGYGSQWATPINSYLYQEGEDLVRVERVDGDVVVETYDSTFTLQNSRTLSCELPDWGGFYAGEEYNFLITGQSNKEENDQKEVIRVTRYDKQWNELDHVGLFGANTTDPFLAGSVSCDEYGGYLYVRTCHEMYTSGDGLNHQANLTFCVRLRDMTITDSFYDVANLSAGYVSHSFNQYILVDREGYVVALDHGDAYPRAAVLSRYAAKAGSDKFISASGSYWDAVDRTAILASFSGSTGANSTGAKLTDLGETSTGYLAALCDTGLGSDVRYGSPADVYLTWTDKNNVRTEGTQVRKVTAVSSGETAQNAYLAPTGTDKGYLVWELKGENGVSLQYAAYSGDGTVGAIQTAQGDLSDCHPILYRGKVTWYATHNSEPVFYTLDDSGVVAQPAMTLAPIEFADLSADHWAYDSIQKMARAKVMNGVGDGRFAPGATITGAEFATMLVRAYWPAAYEEAAAKSQGGDWWADYYAAIQAVNGLDKAQGVADDPTAPISRQDMMYMLYNVLAAKDRLDAGLEPETVMGQFADYSAFRADRDLVERAAQVVSAGLLNGKDGGNFALSDQLTRAEAAAVMARMLALKLPSDKS